MLCLTMRTEAEGAFCSLGLHLYREPTSGRTYYRSTVGDFSILVITCQQMRRHLSVYEVLLHIQGRSSDSPAVLRTLSSLPVGLFGNYRGVTATTS